MPPYKGVHRIAHSVVALAGALLVSVSVTSAQKPDGQCIDDGAPWDEVKAIQRSCEFDCYSTDVVFLLR